MDAMENLLTRRSVRKFKADMVPKEVLDRVLEAGTYAPTGKNLQSPIIIAVTNREERDKIAALNAEIGQIQGDPFYGAPVILIVLAAKDSPHRVYDGSLVMENLMLSAHALGLASCWIHRAKQEFERPEGQGFLAKLGIQGEYEGIGHCALGYGDGEYPQAKKRKENWIYRLD